MNINLILERFAEKIVEKINASEIEKKKEKDSPEDNELIVINCAEGKLIDSKRIELKDKMFFSKSQEGKYYFIEHLKFRRYLFVRGVATNFLFKNIDFSQTIFDSCYLKDCRFINCNFEGAKFINSNLQGSYFEFCNFDYVTFEKTFVDDEIFNCAPKKNNLKYKFARSLKLNYASIGDYIKASNAVKIELKATKSHLYDTWSLSDEYHINKYGGIRRRSLQFWKWLKVCILDLLWGNGESLWRLIRFNLILFFILTVYHILHERTTDIITIFNTFLVKVPSNYFGISVKGYSNKNYFFYYPEWLSLFLVITRLICFGLLMSIIIKKYNRR
ncbi:pentapeptide repeat-containing protein [uncultured Chryseobacterium sp.]|uniref:pentapeptide repeat-containing protein n=1 Tax=uncultured Chryseobacterium sp. TaxID=259322 RepID=UPI0025E61946|nr:pentapeptide repeat-containing protein [uncultured Chryseobacterium sp.]